MPTGRTAGGSARARISDDALASSAAASPRAAILPYAGTIFPSASLLFLVQLIRAGSKSPFTLRGRNWLSQRGWPQKYFAK